MKGPAHATVVVRLTAAELRGKLEAALATARQSLVDADAALAAVAPEVAVRTAPPQMGAPPGFYERSWRAAAADRVAYLEFVLKHLAPGDVVADGAHLHALLAGWQPPASLVAMPAAQTARRPAGAH